MMEAAHRRLAFAERLLGELDGIDPERAPTSAIHTGYYAMFHAATAVIIAAGEDPPQTHSGVIARFSRLVIQRSLPTDQSVAVLGRAQAARQLADYDEAARGLETKAHDVLQQSPTFVAFCRRMISGS
ncbi:HEPN domain-containing protein [Vineibacter terrae]|uniref:HEPN domain-containing protein n=1 Tax=Vineibacter terrae TaxID=2586908 RepID=A0A5C8P8Q5_9HYPH|nr:HEPN domain-containing protein [Vineibacter terrae]TXL70018.1 HEPN domain-containing protein [Vineibacter terrae]